MRVRRAAPATVAATCVALVAGLLVGATPATGAPAYGMLVAATASPQWGWNFIQFRAQPAMVQSDIVVRRTGNTVVISEEDGGPSLGVVDNSLCTSANSSGPSTEVTCTFPASPETTVWTAIGDFSAAPRGASLVIQEGAQIRGRFIGSPFDDYFQGGDLPDFAESGGGNDNLYGGGASDTLRGGPGEDDIDGEDGDDFVMGGDDADTITGGKGVDNIVGGLGADDVEAKDSTRDGVDCGEPFARTSPTAEVGDIVRYDEKLDVVTACNAIEWPNAVVPASLSTTSVKVGETVTGNIGEWTGTAPISFSYEFKSCRSSQFMVVGRACSVVKSGKLDARGLEGGKPPFYKVARSDVGWFIVFEVTARNLPKIGAYAYSEASTGIVSRPPSVTIMGDWLPRQVKGKWVFGDWSELEQALKKSNIGAFVDVTATPVRRLTVPVAWRKVITHDSVVGLKVNGKALTPDSKILVEAGPDERVSVEITYYSWWKDRETCPLDDGSLSDINKLLGERGMPLWLLTALLEGYNSDCAWVVEWSNTKSASDTFMATGMVIEETNDPDVPVRLRITASEPSYRPRLSVAVGAPPQSHVSQRPDDFSIAADGRLYDFPGPVFTSIWVGLLGDQVRESGKRGAVELYMNGELEVRETFQSVSGGETPFSTVLSTASLEPGTARIVVSTLDDFGEVKAQVFVDFTVADGSTANAADLVTWDGRCFSTSGRQATCPFQPNRAVEIMRKTVNDAINGALATFSEPHRALRYASEKLDKRFVAVGANGPITPPGGARLARNGGCWWWDLPCHWGNLINGAAQALTRPKSTKPKPPVKREYRKVVIVRLGDQVVTGAVLGEGILKIPGVGLINLDGGTLINLDGGTLINLDGGTIGPFTVEISELINLDGGTLAALNGGRLIGVDPASIVGLNGATLISDLGSAFAPLTLLTRQ